MGTGVSAASRSNDTIVLNSIEIDKCFLSVVLNVEVRDHNGNVLARGDNLPRTANSPMARLHRQGNKITREDIWPTDADYGTRVIVAGGEVGTLQKWWNDPEQQEWRWSLEFYNHR